jgi:hypothetical protein
VDDDGLTDCAAFIGLNPTWAPWKDGHRSQCAIDMPNKLDALLKAYDCEVTRTAYTPAVPGTLVRHDQPIPEGPEGQSERDRVAAFLPRAFVGLALWLMRGYRPCIAYQVGALGTKPSVIHCFNDTHIAAAKHLLRHLRTTKDYQLVYKRNPGVRNRQPEMWVGADYIAPTTAPSLTTTASPPRRLSELTAQLLTGALADNSSWLCPPQSPNTMRPLTRCAKLRESEHFITT